ncbi:glycosyltransferase family 4 protein [Ferrimonas marina]|uniref:Glycosyl transferases group 1 n=1 Tax=Ferrimonas marina TaxID=299255 RepID=A0A1M5ZQY1_9GAMM|nr:glycosyltransferase family 4 protein [Ferrimonas marina]SHI26529.1 Glycosyl transferases group 1 [Ferrimonas marina]
MQDAGKSVIVAFMLGESATRLTQSGFLNIDATLAAAYLEKGLFDTVYWLTYDANDAEVLAQLKAEGKIAQGIELLTPPSWANRGLGKLWYSVAAPWIHRQQFRAAEACICQQTSGSWTGFIGKLLFGTRFVYRYGHSLWRRHWDRKQWLRLAFSWPLDRILTRFSDHTLVCTHLDYHNNRHIRTVTLCPNFIDTRSINDLPPWAERQERAVYVGRLMSFKNVFNMVEACARVGWPLEVFGDGPLRQEMMAHAEKVGAEVIFHGIQPNEVIREHLPSFKYHLLVSNFEGMPKALLEGMAAGSLCLVTPIFGCTEIIDDGINGLVAGGEDVDSLVALFEKAKTADGQRLGEQAVAKIHSHYSLERVVELHQQALFDQPPIVSAQT